ncbi:M48 family metallopeptidase [Massilia forsythiae]|uniref:M48 family metallopeptidase n=1 Tax=Massilia forsythiae TaxID=2728020 RepID=A0A7Z2VXF0_9BURK|nr:M48 family metallopeptidase [Massilia forsythiae]QJE01071.1 M48 family metallopeptidase [Massilia forsythiae]
MDQQSIEASYFDGRSARLQPARLRVRGDALAVATADGERSYPLAQLKLAEPFAAAAAVLRFGDGAGCEVPAGAGRERLLAALGYRKSWVVRWQERWPAALLSLVLLGALLAAAWLRGIPFVAGRIAARLPVSVDVSLGKAALAGLEAQRIVAPSRLSDERIAEVQALLAPLAPAQPRMPLRLLVRASDRLGANALALPDGTIIVTDRLVRLVQTRDNQFDATSREQLSAVLAHEIGHVERRHAARAMSGSSLTAALSATLFGDFSAVAAGLPTILSHMEYSRGMESEADDYAVAVLHRNGIPVQSFIDVLAELGAQQADDDKLPRWMHVSMGYLSTHPKTSERIARLREASGRLDDEGQESRNGGDGR